MADYSNDQNKHNSKDESNAVLTEALKLGTEKISALLEDLYMQTVTQEQITAAVSAAVGRADTIDKSVIYMAVNGALCGSGIKTVLEGIRSDLEIYASALMSILYCDVLNTTADIRSRISASKDRSKQLFGDPNAKPDPNAGKADKMKKDGIVSAVAQSVCNPSGKGILQAILELIDVTRGTAGTSVEFHGVSMKATADALDDFLYVLKKNRRYLTVETIDRFGEFMYAYIDIIEDIIKHKSSMKSFVQITAQMAKSIDYIMEALRSPFKLMYAAELGKIAIRRAASFFTYTFDKAFTPALLSNMITRTKQLLACSQQFDNTTKKLLQSFEMWSDAKARHNIRRARKSIKKMAKFFVKATEKLIPAIEDFNKQMPDIKTTTKSVESIASVYKALAVISIAAVPITLLYPVARLSIVLAKGLIKGFSGLADTIHDNRKSFNKGLEGVRDINKLAIAALITIIGIIFISKLFRVSAKEILIGVVAFFGVSLVLAINAWVVGQIAKSKGKEGVKMIYDLVWAALIVLGVLMLLQYFMSPKLLLGVIAFIGIMAGLVLGIWGIDLLMKQTKPQQTIDIIKSICWATIGVLATLLLVAIVFTAFQGLVLKGFLVEFGLLVGQVIILAALRGLIKLLGGIRVLREPLELIILLCVAALLTVVSLIILTKVVTSCFVEVLGGIVILGIIMVGLILIMRLMAQILTERVKVKLYGTFIALGMLILATLVTLGLIKLAAMMASWDTVFGVVLIGVIMFGLIQIMKEIQKQADRIQMTRVTMFLALVLGTLLLTCLIVGIAATQVNIAWLGVVLIVGLTILGLAYILKQVDQFIRTTDLVKLLEKVALILGTLLVTALILALTASMVSMDWVWVALMVAATVLGLAHIIRKVNRVMSNVKLFKTVKRIALILGVLVATALALGLAQQFAAGLKWETILQLGVVLVGMTGIMYAISKIGKPKDFRKAAEILAIICAAIIAAAVGIMVLAAASMMWNKHTWEAAGLMGAAVVGFAVIMTILGQDQIKKYAQAGSIILLALCAAIVVASVGILILASASQKWNKHTWEAAGLMGAAIVAFGLVAVALGTTPINLFAAIGCGILLLLTGTLIMAATGLSLLMDISKKWDPKAKQYAEFMFDTIVAFGMMIVLLGTPPICAFAAIGCQILKMLATTIMQTSVAILLLATTAKSIDDQAIKGAKKLGDLFTNLFDSLDKLPSIITLGKLKAKIPMFLEISVGLGKAISSIATAVSDIANLKVAEDWDAEGHPISYRQINDNDFQLASENVTKIVTTLGGAVMDLYIKDKENGTGMFVYPWMGDNPFTIVTKSCSTLGVMISKIATGVQEMANLKVADEWDTEGHAISYRQINENDFKLASVNITEIVTTMGNAVLDLYIKDKNNGTQMFTDEWIGDNPFVVVVNSCMKLGKMIAVIAKGVSDMANLKVATDWDKEGKPIDYRTLNKDDFELAKNHVITIATTFATSIVELAANPAYKDFFQESWYESESDFARVIKACTNIGTVISNIADGILKVANGTYKTYDKNGKETGTFSLGEPEYKKAALNINSIFTVLFEGDGATVPGIKDFGIRYRNVLTDDGSAVKIAIDVMKNVTDFIGKLADTIIKMANGTYQYTDASGKKIEKQLDSTTIKLATKNIALMMGGILAGIKCIYEQSMVGDEMMGPFLTKSDIGIITKNDFWGSGTYEDIDYESSPFAASVAAVSAVVDVVGKMTDSVLKIAAGEYNGKQLADGSIALVGITVATVITGLINGIKTIKLTEEDRETMTASVDMVIDVFNKFIKLDIEKLFQSAPKVEENTKTVVQAILEQMTDFMELQTDRENSKILAFFSQTHYDEFKANTDIFLVYNGRIQEVFKKAAGTSAEAEKYKSPRKFYDSLLSDIDYIRLQLNDRAQFKFNITVLEQFGKVMDYTQKITKMNSGGDIKEVRGLIHDINTLDSIKVTQFKSIFEAISTLATKLGSIDHLAQVLSTQLTASLRELTEKLALAGAQIDKADEYQQKRKKELSELINSIVSILDKPIMVTPAPLEEDSSNQSYSSGPGQHSSSTSTGQGTATDTNGGGDSSGASSYATNDDDQYVPPSKAQSSFRPDTSDQTAMLAQALSYLRKMYGMLNA